MSEDGAAPDLVQLTRQSMEATNRRKFDAALSVFAEDAVFDVSSAGLGRFQGRAAIRGYLEDWIGAYEEQEFGEWQGQHLGDGVVFAVVRFDARPVGSRGEVRERWAFTIVWRAGVIVSVTASQDIGKARADAERLAGSPG